MMSVVYIFQIGVVSLLAVGNCDVFTAITSVEKLLHTLENVLINLEQYIEIEENRHSVLKRYLKEFTTEQEKANIDGTKYVENPINAFTLIKRLSTDFERMKAVASDTTEFLWDRDLLYPTEEDLIGAAVAIARLQDFYKLNTTQVAEGNLKNVFGSLMSASDCHKLAVLLYTQGGSDNYKPYAAQWFEATRDKLDVLHVDESPFSVPEMISYNGDNEDGDVKKIYRQLCRGELNISSANASKLHCVYLKRNAFLRLAPIKMEVLFMNPAVFLFHDVLADSEIEIIKRHAVTKLQRAKVTGKPYSDKRIAKTALLGDNIDAVAKLRRRTGDFTGLDMAYAEQLQILNYGIGGYFDLHFDGTIYKDGAGTRLATVVFYMSNVTLGGATVFPEFQLTVWPKKGSALHWINLDPSGKEDKRMLHAACPVLHGCKWVANQWIEWIGQELFQTCPLTGD